MGISLLGNSKILLLDEPSLGIKLKVTSLKFEIGLDDLERQNLWLIIRKLKNAGKTIIIATNNMKEAESLADNLAILFQGILRLSKILTK